jgi:hypothetical protein
MQKLPQLTLRDLFWLAALVAMGCGWWVERRMLKAELQEALPWKDRTESLQSTIERDGYEVTWGDDVVAISKPGSYRATGISKQEVYPFD